MIRDLTGNEVSVERRAAIKAEADAWARELATGRPTTQDGEIFRRWRAQSPLHEQAWVQAARDWRKLGSIAQAYDAQRSATAARSASPRMGRRVFLGAAASAFGALAVVAVVRPPLGLWPSWTELGADYRTATGQQQELALDGRIQVLMNTQTSLNVQTSGQSARLELLAGEAAVSARQGSACEIWAGDGHISLTSGDIEVRRMQGDQVRVRCTQGGAQLSHPFGVASLQANQALTYDSRHLGAPVDIQPEPSAWRQGMVVFHNLPLDEAVQEINRYRPGRVVLMNDALAQRRLSARFEVGALDEAITLIEQLYQAKVRRVGDVVVLT
ncbi:putative FecR [Pusillimonas sp. T7-7]|uniref:FecR family protein n=1 Tax=Pusillimonas sp. (strain T7-7) TaxID=1007105 RepID=UPI0002084AED|nr:FecR domain-containing protein [Pusillimonas sp. T7-7]AEC18807.1 putative FecR [Pusillimonas sp. T7-7]